MVLFLNLFESLTPTIPLYFFRSLQELIIAHHNDPTLPVNPLSMKLSGILDAAVMGGITNYEKVLPLFIPDLFYSHWTKFVLFSHFILLDLLVIVICHLVLGIFHS